MIESPFNAVWNSGNPNQGGSRKVLCVCSAGLLRSPSTANVLHTRLGYNTRAAGSSESFALIPVSTALIHWADEIVFVNQENYNEVVSNGYDLNGKCVTILDVPDMYNYMDETLQEIIYKQYMENV